MNRQEIFENIKRKGSFLIVGLDTDIRKIPACLQDKEDPIFEFNKAIVDATAQYCVGYKPNLAFYEQNGPDGMHSFRKTVDYIRKNYADQFVIADAKRGDIGNTSKMYADAFFDTYGVDAVTLSPYMGLDSAAPFLEKDGKWTVVLALTSNKSSADFEQLKLQSGEYLYEAVLKTCAGWGTSDNTMFVVGATKAESLVGIRKIVPDHFLLVPGIGAQGGSLDEVAEFGMNSKCGLLVNSSRAIIYASSGEDFAEAAAKEASAVRDRMNEILKNKNI